MAMNTRHTFPSMRKGKAKQIDLILVMTKQKKWYHSNAIVGGLVSIVMALLGLIGLVSSLTPEELMTIAASIIAAVSSIITSIWSIIGSFKRKTQIEPIFKAKPIDDEYENL